MISSDLQKASYLHLSRRQLLRRIVETAGVMGSLAVASDGGAWAQDKTGLPSNPFTLGVASGDPAPDGVVLWTRLAPGPAVSPVAGGVGGFNSTRNVTVRWEVATDPAMTNIVQRGAALAVRALAHSVHVELRGLQPSTIYYYRFIAGTYTSQVGRTKTAPALGAPVNQLRFALVSCSDYQNGYFTAYRDIAAQDLDMVVHVGDYLYEYAPDAGAVGGRQHNPNSVFKGVASQMTTLEDYRNRHALYKQDPDLLAAHLAHPFVLTWDDHETENNYANLLDEIGDNLSGYGSTLSEFTQQRANAYQAYYEHMPLRITSLPQGAQMRIYRRLQFGSLLSLHVCDTRQYRTDQPLGTDPPGFPAGSYSANDFSQTLPAGGNPNGTLLGSAQEASLLQDLNDTPLRWNLLAQQTMMARFNFAPAALNQFIEPDNPLLTDAFNLDQWDGYGAARQRLLDFFAARPQGNFVVLTGDIHSSWAFDLKQNFNNPASATVASEIICSGITSVFPANSIASVVAAASLQPWTKFFDARKGYALCTLTPGTMTTQFRAVPTSADNRVTDNTGVATTIRTVVTTNGVPGVVNA